MPKVTATLTHHTDYKAHFTYDEVRALLVDHALHAINKELVSSVDAVVLKSDSDRVTVRVYSDNRGGYLVEVEHDRTPKPPPSKAPSEQALKEMAR